MSAGRDTISSLPPTEPLAFTPAAARNGTDLDILMGYQVFLGRDPENSFVIDDAKGSPVRDFFRACVTSTEFRNAVLTPYAAGRRLPHERGSVGPSVQQRQWIAQILDLPPPTRGAIVTASTWRALFDALLPLPGFPATGTGGTDEAGRPDVPARDPADGFLLIQLEEPKAGERLTAGMTLTGRGWAIAPADIVEIAILLDDHFLCHATYGQPRPDIARRYPHYRHVDHCGFSFAAELPETSELGDTSQLVIRMRTERGDVSRRAVLVLGDGDAPAVADQGAPIRLFVEDARIGAEGMLRVRGWALSQARIARIEMFLGDEAVGEAEHGLERPDIAASHGQYPNAGNSGFRLVRELAAGRAGQTVLRVRATDAAGISRQAIVPLQAPPRAAPQVAGDADGIQFCCDILTLDTAGRLELSGWALAESGIEAIGVALDGTEIATAETGRMRADVANRYPRNPHALRSGFALTLAAAPVEAGPHTVRLTLRAGAGETKRVELPVEAHAAAAAVPAQLAAAKAAPRLEIDQPAMAGKVAAETVRGALTVSGWAVAPSGIETVEILFDGKPIGEAYLGVRREDIAAAFPDHPGSLRAGFALVLPAGALGAGEHLVRVIARARDGGAVERDFSILVEDAGRLPPGLALVARMQPEAARLDLLVLTTLRRRPHFSVLLLTPGIAALDAVRTSLASLAAQAYADWSVTVLLPDAKSARLAAATLAPAPDSIFAGRVQVRAAAETPPPSAPARRGDDVTLCLAMLAGDRLGADALLRFAVEHAQHPAAGLIYADDLRLDAGRNQVMPCCKPDWSPELLLGTNYLGRTWCAEAGLMARALVTPASLAGAGIYDAVLRLTEHAVTIRHIPKVLLEAGATRDTPARERAALRAAMARRGAAAEIVPGGAPATWRVRRKIAAQPRVSIIMPTCAGRGLVKTAITTLRERTAYRNFEIIAIDNIPASEPGWKAWLREHADRVVDMPDAFNWSRFNNLGAAAATGEMLLFLNDDIEVRDPGWLDALVEQALRPEVGAVGARLLYPDGNIQHAGQFMASVHARHVFRFADPAAPGPFGVAQVAREMLSVTGACLMTRRDVFDALGGFDEAHSIVNNDVDYCLRAWRAGRAVIYTPFATLTHHELASRADLADTFDTTRFEGAWRLRLAQGDPFHSPRLLDNSDQYAIEPEPPMAVLAAGAAAGLGEVRRILAVKLDHIGDFVTAIPALRALRVRFPAARLCALVPTASAGLARLEPAIDEVIEFNFFHARSGHGQKQVTESELEALRGQLAPYAFDLAIDLRMQPETRPILRHASARVLAGYDHAGRYPWLDVALEWEGDTRLLAKRGHIAERLLQLVAILGSGADIALSPFAGTPDPAALRRLKVFATAKRGFADRPLVAIHPGVGNVVRQWPAASFAALIDMLVAEAEVNVILVGTAAEAEIAAEVTCHVAAAGAVLSLVGLVSLTELPTVLRNCVLFVGNNSGPQHIAAALGVPTVGIHSGVVDAAEWAPRGDAAIALRRDMVCSPCYLEFATDCPRGLACLTGLRPRDVMAECRKMLALGLAAQPARLATAALAVTRRRTQR